MITNIFEFNKQEEVNKFYNSLKGNRVNRVAWNSIKTQEIRFKKLLEIGVKNGDTILDFGCGLGDLYDFTMKNNLNIKYIGVDINEKYIEDAEKHFTKFKHIKFGKPKNFKFYAIDSINDIKDSYDWFIASGSFTMGLTFEEIIEILKKVYEDSNKGVAFNLLKDEDEEIENYDIGSYELMLYYNPRFVVNELKKKFHLVGIVDDYLYNDFTIYLKK